MSNRIQLDIPVTIKTEEKENGYIQPRVTASTNVRTPLQDQSQTLNKLMMEPPDAKPRLSLTKLQQKRPRSTSPQKQSPLVATHTTSRIALDSDVSTPVRTPLISDEVARENKGRDRYSTSMQKPPGEREWTIEDFVVNPKYNHSLDFAFDHVLRGSERECVHGRECDTCKQFYETVGHVTPLPTGPIWNDDSPTPVKRLNTAAAAQQTPEAMRKLIAQTSRHKKLYTRPASPVGFWRSEFPSTQEELQDREQNERVYQDKVQERLNEALKGGRYIFKDKSMREQYSDLEK
ncbi:hypothetical protein V1512DRAFT_208227 [Lipomyces arxii]|uniref:uncharacterized protein n=1 Tax=Lipomyces arxii TaxID=56418 RepID=UPI0034CD94B1